MRILLAAAVLGMTASCILPKPLEYAAPAPTAAASAPMPAAPVALAPPIQPAAAAPGEPGMPPAPELALYLPSPVGWFFPTFAPPPSPGRLTLSNFNYDDARVQALVTAYPDCQPRPDTPFSEFGLPLNGTRIIGPPPGSDVCWRRAMPPDQEPAAAAPPTIAGWTEWNRAFTSSGRSIDSSL